MLTSKKENLLEISLIGIDVNNNDKYNFNLQQILKNICEIHEFFNVITEVYTFKIDTDDGIRKYKNIIELHKNSKAPK